MHSKNKRTLFPGRFKTYEIMFNKINIKNISDSYSLLKAGVFFIDPLCISILLLKCLF